MENNQQYVEMVRESAEYIKSKLQGFQPEICIILGSGLGEMADRVEEKIQIPYGEIPHFAQSTVVGHKGQFVAGILAGKPVLFMQGRFHFYEGYDLRLVTLPIRVAHQLGIKTLVATNAAGGVNTAYHPGQLMILQDHINFTGRNPLIGHNLEEYGVRFPDMSTAYDPAYIALAQRIARKQGIDIQTGVYTWLTGPTYETPAEIRFMRMAGADAVGMSTVPEVIVARHMGMRVLGISCITNMAAGVLKQVLDHKEVTETANRVKDQFAALLTEIVGEMGCNQNLQ